MWYIFTIGHSPGNMQALLLHPRGKICSKFKRKAGVDSFSSRTDTLLLVMMIAYMLYTVLAGLAILPLWLYLRNPYFLKDLNYTITLIQMAIRLNKLKKQKPFYSILDCFLDKVARQPNKKFILFEESSYTFSQADKESNRVARVLSTHAHLKEGDTVAVFLGNEPQFVWTWLALAKLGCTASLLNCNIRSKSLLHCFSCCDAKVLVAGAGKLGKQGWDRLSSSLWFMKCISGFLHYLCVQLCIRNTVWQWFHRLPSRWLICHVNLHLSFRYQFINTYRSIAQGWNCSHL